MKKYFLILVLLIFSTPLVSRAQVLNLKAPKTTYAVGDSFQITLSIDAKGKAINTVSGSVSVPAANLQILDTRYGNSIISLWVERPEIKAGAINFSGGIPGGFSGSAGTILSFGVKVKKAGSATVSLNNFKVLLNDGLGTEVLGLGLGNLKLTLKDAPPPPPSPKVPKAEEKAAPAEEYLPPPDTIPPESFIPIVSRHPSVSDNKYFVSFFAADKDSGIEHYEVKEISALWPFDREDWVRAESPYILKNQWWRARVLVRAYDQAGNAADGEALKPFHSFVLSAFTLLLILAGIFLGRLFHKPFPKRRVKLKI
ncbi:MAG: cohesin domain-containing protein [bacterium]|nr:cohesin domain-containing protein [bacterium]